MSLAAYLNPATWASAISNSFITQLENGILYLLSLFLDALLGIAQSLGEMLSGTMEQVLYSVIAAGEAIGPFGLPAVILGLMGFVGLLILFFQSLKDVPVVGAVV